MHGWTEEYNVNDLGFSLGSVSAKSSSYDGLTDEEAEVLKAELEQRERRRIPTGFAAPTHLNGVVLGKGAAWPVVPRFDLPSVV